MSSDAEQQEDELLALHSIFGSDEFFRDESKSAGEIHVSVELPAGFCVSLREGESLRQYEMSSLPPLLLTFELSEHYPSSSPPTFSLTCSWLSHTQLSALCAQLADLYQDAGGAVVLFTWIQFLKEEALSFLDIHTVLELPSDDPSTQSCSPDPLQAAVSRPEHPPHSGPADAQSAESWPNLDDQKNCNDSNPASHPSDVSEAAAGGGSAPRPAVQSSGDEESDSGPAAGSERGATSVLISPGESLETQDQTLSGLSLTPSQTLLSQLLLHDADQKQRRFATTVFDCGVCFMSFLGSECVEVVECGHIFCRACLAQFCKLQITEGNVRGVTCLQADCTAAPTPAQVRSLVGEELFSRYDRLLLQITLDCMSDVVYCPRQSCGSAVILDSDNAAVCPMCRFAFCVRCKKTYHGADACQKERANGLTELDVAELPPPGEGIRALFKDYKMGSKQRRQLLESRYGRWLFRGGMKDFVNSENWVAVNTKKCPHCFSKIEKDKGCNVMTCSRCLQKFCWACLTRLTLSDVYHHFSSCPRYS